MKLSIPERIMFNRLFPRESSMIEMSLVKDIGEKVKLSQDEIEKIGLKQENSILVWSGEKAKDMDKEIDFSNSELSFLKSQIDRLDREKKVTVELLGLCQKIKE